MLAAVPSNPGLDDAIIGITIQSNGKILAVGFLSAEQDYFTVARYNKNGSLDTTFSGDGMVITNFGPPSYLLDCAYDVAVQSNGKIVVAGETCDYVPGNCHVAIARYNTNGALDTSFSKNGKVITDHNRGNNGSTAGLLSSPMAGSSVAGYMWNGTDYDFAVYRYNVDGSLWITPLVETGRSTSALKADGKTKPMIWRFNMMEKS